MLYASGEESPDQIRLRADRLEEDAGAVHVLGETRLEAIVGAYRRRLVGESGPVERPKQPVSRAISREHAAGPIAAVCGGGEAKDVYTS